MGQGITSTNEPEDEATRNRREAWNRRSDAVAKQVESGDFEVAIADLHSFATDNLATKEGGLALSRLKQVREELDALVLKQVEMIEAALKEGAEDRAWDLRAELGTRSELAPAGRIKSIDDAIKKASAAGGGSGIRTAPIPRGGGARPEDVVSLNERAKALFAYPLESKTIKELLLSAPEGSIEPAPYRALKALELGYDAVIKHLQTLVGQELSLRYPSHPESTGKLLEVHPLFVKMEISGGVKDCPMNPVGPPWIAMPFVSRPSGTPGPNLCTGTTTSSAPEMYRR
jgi:hypothetical protein